ncbi:CmcJ/NvfI family oxidoreductase, partial [Acinetobacter baumannii]
IDHYADTDLTKPSHSGEIYSMHYSPRHRWFYVADQQPSEVLVFKCYDSSTASKTRFAPHSGFLHPDLPAQYQPRISIEA